MNLSFRCGIAALGCGFLAVICSCEKHHAGELPEQGEHDRAPEDKTPEVAPSPSPSATATPAEFFPTSTPS
jgi:hypothetical protein